MSEIIHVQKLNKVLDIPDERLKEFLDKGYNQVDEQGNILKEAIPNDIGMLRVKYLEHTKQIEDLNKEIAKLKNQISKKEKDK